jgi:hypothetical protein
MTIDRDKDKGAGNGRTGARGGMLGEIASDAGIERSTFLMDSAEQLTRFLEANKSRIKDLGGMVLIDDDPDYLSVAPDGSFRSRSRYQDETTGKWVSETEVIDTAAELVELYNPADIYSAFAEAARAEAGLAAQPTGAEDLFESAGVAPSETVGTPVDPYAEAADDWAAAQVEDAPSDPAAAARQLYDLALTFQERSQMSEARLVEQFESAAVGLARVIGDQIILDDDDERLWFKATGSFEAEVLPETDEDDETEGQWQQLHHPEELVQFYDPTDLFGDLAESLADNYPGIAPDDDDEDEAEADDAAEAAGEGADEGEDDNDEHDVDADPAPQAKATDATATDATAADATAADAKPADAKPADDGAASTDPGTKPTA